MRKPNVVAPMAILTACAVAEAAIGYSHSVDVRGWSPFGLAVSLLVYASYSMLFGLIAGDRVLPTAYIVGFNGVLAAVRVMASYIFYTLPIDWGAVDAHIAHLTAFQIFMRSGWTTYLPPVPFLVAHFIAVRVGWLSDNRQRLSSAR